VPILVSESGDTGRNEESGAPVFGDQDAIAQRSSPELASNRANRHTVDPLRVPTDHPSPSAHEFRLLLKGLAHIWAETVVLQLKPPGTSIHLRGAGRRGACAVPCPCPSPGPALPGHRRRRSPAEKRVKRARARKNNARAQRKSETEILVSESGDTVETKRAVHRWMRSLNDPHQGSLPTAQTVTPLTRCACQPTIRHHPPTNSDSCSKG
jgi:hypothetical protein